jgi:hypothetical protein
LEFYEKEKKNRITLVMNGHKQGISKSTKGRRERRYPDLAGQPSWAMLYLIYGMASDYRIA